MKSVSWIASAVLFCLMFPTGGFAMEIKSSAFQNGKTIPKKYTCEGDDISPPLAWSGVPQGTKSFALISDDPDAPAGTWVHWVLYNLPASATNLPEGVPTTETLSDGARQGETNFRHLGYGGPCPPPGKPHRYYFKLYALDIALKPPTAPTKTELLKMMEGHSLAEAQLMGTYEKELTFG